MNLLVDQKNNYIRNVELTVLCRKGGTWSAFEVTKLTEGLGTEAYENPEHPECVILLGSYTKEQTLRAIGGGLAYAAEVFTGALNPALPFAPPVLG